MRLQNLNGEERISNIKGTVRDIIDANAVASTNINNNKPKSLLPNNANNSDEPCDNCGEVDCNKGRKCKLGQSSTCEICDSGDLWHHTDQHDNWLERLNIRRQNYINRKNNTTTNNNNKNNIQKNNNNNTNINKSNTNNSNAYNNNTNNNNNNNSNTSNNNTNNNNGNVILPTFYNNQSSQYSAQLTPQQSQFYDTSGNIPLQPYQNMPTSVFYQQPSPQMYYYQAPIFSPPQAPIYSPPHSIQCSQQYLESSFDAMNPN
jgi:hypothetical protein